MPQLIPGQTFPSLADFKKSLQEWAVEEGFTPAILDSDTHRVRAGCRSSSGCTFRIRANFSTKNNQAKVTTIHNEHTCSSGSGEQDIKRAAACRVKFLSEAVPKLMTVTEETPTKAIIEAIERRYGQKIAMRQAQKVKSLLCPKEKGPCKSCGNKWHRVKRCPRLPQSPNQQDDDNQGMELDDHEEPFPLDLMQDADPNPPSPDRNSPLTLTRTSNGTLPVPSNSNHIQPAIQPTIRPITPPVIPAKLTQSNLNARRSSHQNNVRHNSITHPSINHNATTQNNSIGQHNRMNQTNSINQNSNINQNNPPQPNIPPNSIPSTWDSDSWEPQLTQRTQFHHHHHQQDQHQPSTAQTHSENPLTQLTTTVANNAVSAATAIPQIATFSMQPATPMRQDKSTEIARLLEQAGRMMQEAAKLTFEAARLTAATAS